MIGSGDINRAMAILFGDDFSCNEGTFQYLQPSGIKKAFRSKAMLYHPDHAAYNRVEQNLIAFHELQSAYQLLMDLKQQPAAQKVRNRHSGGSDNTPRPKKRPPARPPEEDFYYRGQRLPQVKLRLGEYLYYSGYISWRTLIEAIVDQRKGGNRLFGEYFVRKGMISRENMVHFLQEMRRHNFSLKKT